jgi:hypothetical protein
MVRENELIGLDFLKHYRSTFAHAVDFDGSMMRAYHASSWPNAVVIDKSGKVIAHEYIWKGGIGILEKALERLASEEPYVAGSSLGRGKAFCKGGICYAPLGEDEMTTVRRDFPRLAASPRGPVYLTYTSNETGDNNIFLEVYRGGESKARYQITASPSDEYDSDVAVADDGTVWLTWTSNADSSYDVYAASFKDGVLGKPYRLTKSTNDAFHPRIATAPNGDPCVVYYRWIPEGSVTKDRNVYLRRFHGGRWSEELEVSPPEPAAEDHSDPDVAFLGDRTIVAWSYDYHPSIEGNTLDAASPTVFVQAITDEPARDGSFELLGSTGRDERIKDISPAIASFGDRAACAWDANKAILVRRYEGGEWLGLEKVSTGSAPCNTPSVAVTKDAVYVCYSQLQDGRWRIVGRVFTGGMWRALEIKDDGTGDSRFPSLCVDGSGKVWIAYARESGRRSAIRLAEW